MGKTVDKIDRTLLSSWVGEAISNLKISSGSQAGDNVAGSLKSIQVTTESGKMISIIIKLPPESSPPMLSYVVTCRVLELENYFYGTILGKLQTLIKARAPLLNSPTAINSSYSDTLPFPKYFPCEGGTDVFLALEDLRPSGYRMANKYEGLTLQETSLALAALGRFHALSYCLIREYGEKIFEEDELAKQFVQFPWFPRQMDPKYHAGMTGSFTAVVDIMKKHRPALGSKMEKLTPTFLTLFQGTYHSTDTLYFPVICHGDFWVNNILYKYDAGSGSGADTRETPIDVKFIDLQQTHRGNIFEDLMYFFVTSTTPTFRKNHLVSVLKTYHDSFARTISELKYQMPLNFSLGFLIDNFYKNLVHISVFVGGAIAFQLGALPVETVTGGEDEPAGKSSSVEAPAPANENTDNDNSDAESEIIFLKRFLAKDLMAPGEHFDGMGDFCATCLEGDRRAVDRFLDVMEEFDELGVFE